MFIIIRTMGNLGRAGYGATLEGLWPYSYDSCDVGTLSNQTLNGLPEAAVDSGATASDGHLSYLPGQRLSRCTCNGENHPGPKHSDGTFVGRAAPEIDIFEAQVRIPVWCTIDFSHCLQTTGQLGGGQVSQSAQWAVSVWERLPSEPTHLLPAIQPRVPLGQYNRPHVYRRSGCFFSEHFHR